MCGLIGGTGYAFSCLEVEADAANKKGGATNPYSVLGDCSRSLPVASRQLADGLLGYY